MQSNRSTANTDHTLEIMFTQENNLLLPHILRNIKLIPKSYGEMKTHVPLNKTVDWLCIPRQRTAYEPQPDETEKEGIDKRETEAVSTNACVRK